MRSESGEETFGGAGGGFDVRVIKDRSGGEGAGVFGHGVEKEAVEAVAGPRVVAAQGFEDDERLTEMVGPFDGAIERKI